MAQTAEQQDFMEDPISSRRLVSGASDEVVIAIPRAVVLELPHRESLEESEDFKTKAAHALDTVRDKISQTYDSGKSHLAGAYKTAAETSLDLSRKAQRHARYMKEEQPLQVLAIAAGSAFAIGVALRIWRSSRYEQ